MTSNPFEYRVVKIKKLGKDATVQISENEHTNRICIDYVSTDGRIKIQKTFQANYDGKKQAKEFEVRFKSLEDMKTYLGF